MLLRELKEKEITMKEEIEKLIKEVCKNWDAYKALETKEKDYDSASYTYVTTLAGDRTEWDNPDLLWLLSYSEDGGYDGSGVQVGISKDGRIIWEYQSHCSCNSFEDSEGAGHNELCLGCDEKPKSYELNMLPKDWEKIALVNLQEILKQSV